jgi:hypothetical protein
MRRTLTTTAVEEFWFANDLNCPGRTQHLPWRVPDTGQRWVNGKKQQIRESGRLFFLCHKEKAARLLQGPKNMQRHFTLRSIYTILRLVRAITALVSGSTPLVSSFAPLVSCFLVWAIRSETLAFRRTSTGKYIPRPGRRFCASGASVSVHLRS